jgi:hypothetical protein
LAEIKERVRIAQYHALNAVNKELVGFRADCIAFRWIGGMAKIFLYRQLFILKQYINSSSCDHRNIA